MSYTLIVAGSRSWTKYSLMYNTLIQLIEDHGRPGRIISGGAKGADSQAKTWAKRRKMKDIFEEMKPQWKNQFTGKYNPRAGLERNAKMIQEITSPEDRVVVFLDTTVKSNGSKDTITKARKRAREIEGGNPDEMVIVVCDPPTQLYEIMVVVKKDDV